ncbi:glycoside hydrolase family 3 N-terminal domain-containing protein [Streptomyces sp. NPDC088354]|uniref:glycoside hydrolase family 3 N-terminal domain-containing protein n=1 Tax=Streptomyces sp. NPDC088354 TaxID=3365856 RepID=UPI0037F6E079
MISRHFASRAGLALLATTLAVAGCDAHRSPDASGTARAMSATTAAASTSTCAQRVEAAMNDTQRVGQLFMGAAVLPTTPKADLDAMRTYAVGSVMLAGRSTAGVQKTRAFADQLQGMRQTVAGQRVGLLISTDQEGGQVQVLKGPGFSTIPNGVTQGRYTVTWLRQQVATWTAQLRSAGVNVNLAPVADIVPASLGTANAPIGKYGRQFGSTSAVVSPHVTAYVQGGTRSKVLTTPKHFPGLGSVRGNTDVTAGVTDTTLTRTGANVAPFKAGIAAGAALVMVSTATYKRIDAAHQAAYSSVVITGMLRNDLGFKGVVISDDLGKAASAQSLAVGKRALAFLRAGGDLVLTVQPTGIPAMAEGIRYAMRHEPAVRTRVHDSVLRVLAAKEAAGVLACTA